MNAEVIFFECLNVLKYVFINMATRYDALENQRKGCFSQYKVWLRACPNSLSFQQVYNEKKTCIFEIILLCHSKRALFVRVFEGRPCFLVLLKYALALPEHLLKAKMVGNEHWATLHLTDILEIGFESSFPFFLKENRGRKTRNETHQQVTS